MERSHTDRLASDLQVEISRRNDEIYSMEVPVGKDVVILTGKVDGIIQEDGQPVLVETKSRRNRLFAGIPVYEKVQMEAYMRMIGASKAIWNQRMGCSPVASRGAPS